MGELVRPDAVTGPENCPEREYHGKPFRYCPVKGCGWVEPPKPPKPSTVVGVSFLLDELMNLGEDAKDTFWDGFDQAVAAALNEARLPSLRGGKVTITVQLDDAH